MSEIQFDVNVANGVANDVLPVWWMEVYPFRINQSESMLHAEIKWFKVLFCHNFHIRYPIMFIVDLKWLILY